MMMTILIQILTLFFTLVQASKTYNDVLISQSEVLTFSRPITDYLGMYLSTSKGDFNADGYEDFLLGAQYAGAGIVYVIFGSKNGLSDLTLTSGLGANQGVEIRGAMPGSQLGSSLGYAGDVNDDGIDDIIIGAMTWQSSAYVIYGSKTPPAVIDLSQGLSSSQGFSIAASGPGMYLGKSVSCAGDVNNDKIDDLIIGATGFSNGKGAAYVIFGKKGTRNNIELASGLSSSDGFSIIGAGNNNALGTSVGGGGDIDGDGIGDVIIGATGAEDGYGAVYVIYGKDQGSTFSTIDLSQGLSSSQGFKMKGGVKSSNFASTVANAGDFNGDGFDDVVTGSKDENALAGAVHIIFGGPRSTLGDIDLSGSLDPARGIKMNGAASSYLGYYVSSAGDVNGDGITDIILGAPQAVGGLGAAYVIFGKKNIISLNLENIISTGIGADKGFRIIGGQAGRMTGISVGLAGDVNGDGISDVLVGAPSLGAVYLYLSPVVCPENCLKCEKLTVCMGCDAGYGLYEDKCLGKCPQGTELANGICVLIIEEDCPDKMELVNEVCVPKKTPLETVSEISKGLFDSGSVVSRIFTMGRSLSVSLGLMAKIIQNVRYLNISYPQETLSAFESYGTDLFELPIPGMLYESPDAKELPSQYLRYDIDPSFMENYWGTMMMIMISLVLFLVIRMIQYLTKSQDRESMYQMALKNVGQTAANFTVIQMYSSFDDVVFFFLLDASSTKMSSVSSGLSLGVGSIFLLLGLALVCVHCWVLGKYQKAKEQDQLERFQEKFRILGTLYEDFKDDNAVKQSFFGILILRCVFLVLVIMLLQPPWIQASLLMIANLIFLGYFIYQRPFQSRFDEISQYFCEATIFAAYLSMLVLSVFDYKEDFISSERNGFGRCIVIAGIVLSLGGFLIQVIQIIGAIYGIYKFFKGYMKKESNRVPISTIIEHKEKISEQKKSKKKGKLNESSQIELKKNFTIPEVTENSQYTGSEFDISWMIKTDNKKISKRGGHSEKVAFENEDLGPSCQMIEARTIKVLPKVFNQMEGTLKKRKKLRIKSKFSGTTDVEKD